MHRLHLCATALAALTLVACVDTQSPDDSRAPTLEPPADGSLPVLGSMKVAAKPSDDGYTITLRFVNQPTAAQQSFFETAAAKWQSIIVGDVPSTTGRFPPRTCSGQIATPGFNGTIDDVLIDVLLTEIDDEGGILGAAGPCLARTADFLTLYGVMYFDTADLAFLEQFDILDEVIVHEMGHVLGFGTLWNYHRALLQGSGTADPRFVGPAAIAAYDRLGGTGAVPVEGDGGPGTAYAHWDEEAFQTELMTGFIALGDSPLSGVSVGSMGDLGYVVNLHAGDPYRLPRSGGGPALAAARAGVNLAARERLLRPVAVVE